MRNITIANRGDEYIDLTISKKLLRWLEEDVSNMAIVDVKLVTGFSVREESLEEVRLDNQKFIDI